MSKEYFYPELDLVEKNGKRYYLDSNNHPVPSVTVSYTHLRAHETR